MSGRLRLGVLVLAGLVLYSTGSLPLVVARTPGQDAARSQSVKGTARIEGRVVDAASGLGLRRVRVSLSGPPGRPQVTVTDATGAFMFGSLPAGRFRVTATRTGYVQVPGGPPSRSQVSPFIQLAEGEVYDRATITMLRGGVVTGRLVDEFGDPVVEASVRTFRAEYMQGMRRLVSARGGETDDRGQFRIAGLAPGRYYLMGAIPVRAERDDSGRSTVAWGAGSAGLAPTFYPGTLSAADAQPVHVTAGAETQASQFALVPARLARITGTVTDSRGRPGAEFLVLLSTARPDGALVSSENMAAVDARGNFTLSNVAPGEYRLDVRAKAAIEAIAKTGRVGGPQQTGAPEFASMPVTVGGDDVDGVAIVTGRGYIISGTVVADGSARVPDQLRQVSISVMPVLGSPGVSGVLLSASARLDADGAFEVKGLIGQRLIQVGGLPPGWVLKSVSVGSHDVTDSGIDLDRNLTDVVVTITSKLSSFVGQVVDVDGKPAAGGRVAIFARDRARWSQPMSRYVMETGVDDSGKFSVSHLPPGDYFAAAVDDLEPGEWAEPASLDELSRQAAEFSIAEGEARSLILVRGTGALRLLSP